MSIPDKLSKIKAKRHIDKFTVMYFVIIFIVSIFSYQLGKINNKTCQSTLIQNQQATVILSDTVVDQEKMEEANDKKYVASKNGSKYYPINCKGANRINPENMIYFDSENEAIMSGFELSNLCK